MTGSYRLWAAAMFSRFALLSRDDVIRESCIASTKITQEVLRAIGVHSRPLVVSVNIFNQPMARRLAAGQVPIPGNAGRWFEEDGSWSVGVAHDADPQPGAFSAHMTLIADNRFLVDSSLDQMSRPHRGINLAPVVIRFATSEAAAKFTQGGAANREGTENDEGTVIIYEAHPNDRSYRDSNDWKKWQERYAEEVAKASRVMRAVDSGQLPKDRLGEILGGLVRDGFPETPSDPKLLHPGPFT